jgi:hypothetical protein
MQKGPIKAKKGAGGVNMVCYEGGGIHMVFVPTLQPSFKVHSVVWMDIQYIYKWLSSD